MPLTYNWGKCDKAKLRSVGLLHKNGEPSEKLTHFCFLLNSVGVGYPELTQKNLVEVAARVFACEGLCGFRWYKNRLPDPYTMHELRAMIGYQTNAGEKTRAEFFKELELHETQHRIDQDVAVQQFVQRLVAEQVTA